MSMAKNPVSIPEGAIEGLPLPLVSIPEGAIEGGLWPLPLLLPLVSIPEGAIEGQFSICRKKQKKKFQYPKVRLKVMFHQVPYIDPQFQYPKVRLKENQI